MDVTALLVFVSGFVVCAGVVFLISIFGAKEETFEEALAKQRKANEKEKKTKEKKKENDNKKSKNWRMKKKGERDDKNDGLDEEEEQVVLVPAGAKIEDVVEPNAVVAEKVQEQAPEPKPVSKKEKTKKNKIEIKEVEAEVEAKDVQDSPIVVEAAPAPIVEEVPVQVEAKPVKSSPAKQKTKKEKSPEVTAPVAPNPKELLAYVKKTAFNDTEAQKLIDVLLTKQSGDALNTSDEWIEKGKPSESQRLKQELTETLQFLEEERNKVKSYNDKMTIMRKELNEEKSARASHNRVIEDIRKSAGQEVSALNSRLQAVMADNSLLQNNLQSEVALRRNIEMGQQSHYQATIDQLNQQLAGAKMAAAQAKVNDPHLLTELEQLRTLRDKYEKTLAEININNSNLKNQINQQTDELSNIKRQLSSSSDKVSQLNSSNASLEKALAAKTEEANKASSELKSLKSKPAAPAPVINNNNINVEKVEAELAIVKQKLVEKDQETKRLMEENERLSEQVASSVERPAADGQEANGALVNGHGDAQPAADKADSEWKEKFDLLNLEHEKMLAKQKVIQSDFDAEVSKVKDQLETMKSKNNDLSSSLVNEKKKACTELLVRLFPNLSGTKNLDSLEEGAKTALESLSKGETQVAHYKSVLAQTETMLTALQTSVETVESEWRLKLDAANKEISELKVSQPSGQSSSHINESQQMQEQLSDLQVKLAKEEEDKTKVTQLSQELDKEVERLSVELSDSKKMQEELTKQVNELKITNTSLKDLVDNAQVALTKEKILVKNFQDQVSSGKVENGQSSPEAASSDTNHLTLPSSISTPSLSPSVASIDSTTNTSPEKKKKSKKKKTVQ